MRKGLILFMLLTCSVLAFSQTRSITGQIRDKQGEPVPFVTIKKKGTNSGTVGDSEGKFAVQATKGDVLLLSGANITALEVTIEDSDMLNIQVVRSAGNLDEVVVTAMGLQRQSKELGYSTVKVKGSELTQAKVVNLQNGLTGKVSGLNIQTVNNGVFADTRITLRGIRSLTGNNQPMLVLDGVPISLGYLNSINPNDIADVTILKSSSATVVYGPEGVNGAIVVSTKRGTKSTPSVTLSHTLQMETVSFMPKLQTRFGSGASVDGYGYGVYDPIENQCYGPEFDGSMVQIGRIAPDGSTLTVPYTARPKEKLKFWDKGFTNQTDVSFTAGDFYLSAQNVDIKGIVPKDENHRRSIHMTAKKEYGNFKASFNLNYTNSKYNVHAGNRFGTRRMVYWLLINTPMHIPITRFKDWRNDYWSNPNGYFSDYYSNPYWAIDNFRAEGKSHDVMGNVELSYKVANWLNLVYRLGGTVTDFTDKGTQTAWTYSAFAKASGKNIASDDLKSAVHQNSSNSSRLNSELFATLHHDINRFRIDGLVGYSFRESNATSTGVESRNLGIAEVYNVAVRQGDATVGQSESKTRLQRFFVRAAAGLDNWAFAEITGSYDMDSRLANPYDFDAKDIGYFYPGASLSFILSEAITALKESKTISYMKLRGALSKTGNVNLGAYNLENTYSPGEGFPYGSLIGFTSNNTLVQDSYKPEFVINKEVGLEFGFLKNRINFEATLYEQDNTNQIITVAYSGSTGYSNALLNAASFTNKGIELDLRLTPLLNIGKAVINLKANYTYQTNKVKELIDGVDELGIGNGNYIIKGMSAYTFKLTDYVRDDQGRVIVDRETGLPTVDPVIKTFGQTLPRHILGLSLSANWKGAFLNMVADYRGGNQIYCGVLGDALDFTGIGYRTAVNGRQPFIMPNSVYKDASGKYVENKDVYTTGGYDFYSVAVNRAANSNYIASGAFWKLREVSLGYTFPAKWLVKTPVKEVTFTLTGRNLLTWLPKTNQWTDPEFSSTTGNAQGVSGLGNTPPTRIFGANLNIIF
jgi:TonB-linked SusC/RagA family outer membrane protein